jgi:glycosyltransferase involved in cell wall biosynthesis
MRLVRVAVNAEQLLYPSPGGVGRYTAQLLTVLPELFPADAPVPFTALHPRREVEAVLSAFGVEASVIHESVVVGVPRPLLYRLWLMLGTPALPSLGGACVVHAPSVAVPPRDTRPLVVTVHDAAPELFPDAFPARGRRFHRRGLDAAARRADAVITVSEAAAAEIVDRTPVRAEQITVVPNGVRKVVVGDLDLETTLRAFGLWQRPYVLWVGSLEPRKGVGTLVAAMAQLCRRRPAFGVHTVLAGYDGWLTRDLIADQDRAALGSSLRQLRRVREDELWALYKGATVFAFPSLHEGFGLPVVEAMSQGTPVVASDIAAMREVAGGAAELVAPGNTAAWAEALEGVLDDEVARRALAESGLERSSMFSVEAMVRATRAVYQKVAS